MSTNATSLALLGLLADAVLPGETRSLSASALDPGTFAAVRKHKPSEVLALAVRTSAELPSFVNGRVGTACEVVRIGKDSRELRGLRRVKVQRASAGAPPSATFEEGPRDGAPEVLLAGLTRLLTAGRMRREGIPGRWARVSHEVWKSLGRDPVLRRRTFRELDSEDENVRYRGLRALLEEQRVPAEDGSKAAFARKLFARPSLREPLLRVTPAAVLTLGRRALLREELSIAALRAALDAHVDGADGDRVWASLRSMRDRVLAIATTDAEERDLAETLVRTGGDWEASDLAVIRAAVARIFVTEDGDGPNTLRYLVSALLRVDVPESAEMLAMLTARATTDDQRGHLDATVRVAKAAIARSVAAAARAR